MSLLDKFESAKGKAQQAAQKYGFGPGAQHGNQASHSGASGGGQAQGSPPSGGQVPGQGNDAYGQAGAHPSGPNSYPEGQQQQGAPPSPPYASGTGGLANSFQLPHVLRQGIVQFDPRLNANRAFYRYNAALKGAAIDFDAVLREQHKMAQASYEYGQEHVASRRIDGVGDEVLVDMLDRFAYTSAVQGDIFQAHAKALEEARKEQKYAWLAAPVESDELLQARIRRNHLHRQINELRAQATKQPNSPQAKKFHEAQAELARLESEMGPKEIEAAYAKRGLVRTYYEARGDALMRLGSQLLELGRYEKLLARQIPQGEQSRLADPVIFPADREEKDRSTQPAWSGAIRVSEIFAAIKPALDAAQSKEVDLPQVPAGRSAAPGLGETQVPAGTGTAWTQADPSAATGPVGSGPPAPPLPSAALQPATASSPAALQPSNASGPTLSQSNPEAPHLPSAHPTNAPPPGALQAASRSGVSASHAALTDEPEPEEFHDAHEPHDHSTAETVWDTPVRKGTDEYGNAGFNPFTSDHPVPERSVRLENPWATTEGSASAPAVTGQQQTSSLPPPTPAADLEALRAQAARDAKEHEAQLQAAQAKPENGDGNNIAPPASQN